MGSSGRLAVGPKGPLVKVLVAQSQAFVRHQRQHGRPVTAPIALDLLVDTGATMTVLNFPIATRLGLQQHAGQQATLFATANGVAQASVYDCSLVIRDAAGPNDLLCANLEVAELPLAGIDGLLGMDVLKDCQLSLDGPNASFSLVW